MECHVRVQRCRCSGRLLEDVGRIPRRVFQSTIEVAKSQGLRVLIGGRNFTYTP